MKDVATCERRRSAMLAMVSQDEDPLIVAIPIVERRS